MEWLKKHYYLLFLLCFIFLWIGIINNWFVNIDTSIYMFSQTMYHETTTFIFKLISFFASPMWIIGILLLILIFSKQYGLFFIIPVALNQGINQIIKWIVNRPRPLFPHLVVETSSSFPSGHAMASTVFYGLLILLLWNSNQSKTVKRIGTILLISFIFAICFSRIYLGVHYCSDVLAGIMMALFLLGLLKPKLKEYLTHVKKESNV